jgi:hypothetical protein
MGNHQEHALEVFNHTAHKVMKDALQANNAYYKEVLGQKMNKKLSSSSIYMAEEQYYQVKISKSFYIQYLILVVTWRTDSIFVQVRPPWFRNREQDYLEFYKLWYSSASRVNPRRRDLTVEKNWSTNMTLMGISVSLNAW